MQFPLDAFEHWTAGRDQRKHTSPSNEHSDSTRMNFQLFTEHSKQAQKHNPVSSGFVTYVRTHVLYGEANLSLYLHV